MGFIGELLEKAIESKLGGSNSQSPPQPENPGSYGYGSARDSAPPQVPYPWVSRWDDRDQRWYFLNEQTGQTSWEVPDSGAYGGAPQQQGYYGTGAPQQGYGYYEQGQQQQQQEHKDHSMLYGAAGVAAGVAGGALLMHEGEEMYDSFEQNKADFEQDVENLPDNAARWTGEAVGGVEQIPDRIENGFDDLGDDVEDAVQDVEDFPEDAAGWVGRKVGKVEQFGDNMDSAYDQGVAEGRQDDW